MAGKQETYTANDFSELSRKLKALGKDLTPKENAFLNDAVEAAGKSVQNQEVQGFGYDANAYSPDQTGPGDTNALPTVTVKVKGTFVSQ